MLLDACVWKEIFFVAFRNEVLVRERNEVVCSNRAFDMNVHDVFKYFRCSFRAFLVYLTLVWLLYSLARWTWIVPMVHPLKRCSGNLTLCC